MVRSPARHEEVICNNQPVRHIASCAANSHPYDAGVRHTVVSQQYDDQRSDTAKKRWIGHSSSGSHTSRASGRGCYGYGSRSSSARISLHAPGQKRNLNRLQFCNLKFIKRTCRLIRSLDEHLVAVIRCLWMVVIWKVNRCNIHNVNTVITHRSVHAHVFTFEFIYAVR